MKKTKGLIKNTCKNIVLVILVLLLAVLTVVAWDTGLAAGGTPVSAVPLSWLQAIWPMGDGGYVLRAGETPAAMPIRIALTTRDGLVGAAYQQAQTAALFEPMRPLWKTALAKAGVFEETSNDVLRQALGSQTMLLEYAGDIPISLLSGWLGGAVQEEHQWIHAGILVLTRNGQLFVRDMQEEKLYRAHTTVDINEWDRLAESVTASPCSYASMLRESSYGKLYPETIVMDDAEAHDIFTARAPDFWEAGTQENLQRLLEAFEFESELSGFDEGDGVTQVFVNSVGVLRVSQNGLVHYRATTLSNGLMAYQDSEAEGMNAVAAQVDYAQRILSTALRSVGDPAMPSMLSDLKISEQGDRCVLVFRQALGSVPVQDDELARFEFSKGVLASVRLRLRVYQPTGEHLYILPAAQAAVVAQGDLKRYVAAYRESEDGRMLASAYLA